MTHLTGKRRQISEYRITTLLREFSRLLIPWERILEYFHEIWQLLSLYNQNSVLRNHWKIKRIKIRFAAFIWARPVIIRDTTRLVCLFFSLLWWYDLASSLAIQGLCESLIYKIPVEINEVNSSNFKYWLLEPTFSAQHGFCCLQITESYITTWGSLLFQWLCSPIPTHLDWICPWLLEIKDILLFQ